MYDLSNVYKLTFETSGDPAATTDLVLFLPNIKTTVFQ